MVNRHLLLFFFGICPSNDDKQLLLIDVTVILGMTQYSYSFKILNSLV